MIDVAPLYSNLDDDEEIREIIVLFVNEMPTKIAMFQQELAARNWTELLRIAHQLKGSAGSYGFDEISRAALKLETAIKTEQPEDQMITATHQLINLCQRATSELRPDTST